MDWTDQGIVLAARKHGENALIVQLLTRGHGRHAGLVRGGAGRRQRGIYQPGNIVTAHWRGRLAEHLGAYVCEPGTSHAAALLDDPPRLAALSAACAVAEAALPEREPHAAIYEGFLALLDALGRSAEAGGGLALWGEVYVRWELGLLSELGYGLDLSTCAATGRNDELAYVSPRTGRAVSLSAGELYRDKLLPLPPFLVGRGTGAPSEICDGLRMAGYFLERHVFAPLERPPPPARARLVDRLTLAADL
ncbi:MAG: DNA repair protein RecO [Alphaproteobacteria bacterium]|nr:DNA repair protein RecO [Alphaproteobacteria bacterium]